MFRDYMMTSPSLDGILSHESIVYEGVKRPIEIIRAFEKPVNERMELVDMTDKRKILISYFNDLYGLFMRKMGQFISDETIDSDDEVKLMAILQELIKIKKLMRSD